MSELNVLKKNNKRPDGVDLNRYENMKKWSYHQWAWEFLRRNTKFISDCKEVLSGNRSKQAVARKYGLKKFKHCNAAYKKKSGSPKFSIVSHFIWEDLNLGARKARKIRLNLWPGQLIIRLDLAAAINHEGAIEKQVSTAFKNVEAKIADFKKHHLGLTKQHKSQDQTMGIYIRLLDLKAAGYSNLDCGKFILPKKIQDGATPDDLRDDIKQRLKSAKKMAEEGYKYLSLRDGLPPMENEIPLEVK